jgi:hypothetical protein
MAAEEVEITIEIVCAKLPGVGNPSLHLGIQCDQSIIEMAPADSEQIMFKPTLRARPNADGSVNFLGPFGARAKGRALHLSELDNDEGLCPYRHGRTHQAAPESHQVDGSAEGRGGEQARAG